MPWTQAEIDALKAAIGAGVKRVSYSDRTVEYHSLEEMMKALVIMQGEVEVTEGAGPHASKSTYAKYRSD